MTINVTFISACGNLVAPLPFPSSLDAWRALLGGPIDVCECRGTVAPCAIVCLFQSARVVSGGPSNRVASLLCDVPLCDVPIFGPAVLVAGTSAVGALDEQFQGWDGDEPEPMVAR
jgi:hypothetical protein